ncbi:GH20113 [Drosophila grimshawi]|uniref:ribonuclease Z n=2 Tax=Drosophila grimshawi TaxID=7222 RepID=B4J6X1_DROGR|nr:GH20113 [Drosophila grimshawi]
MSISSSSTVLTAAEQNAMPAKYERQPNVLRKKLSSVVPGSVNLQVLGAGANGSPSAVYLFTDQSRYLFNCGEGTQRLAHEHKTRLSRLEQIFVTRNTWKTVGGLPGLALTIQDAGVRNVGLHGPPHLDTMLQSMRRFVVLKHLQMQTIDATEGNHFEDSIMSVESLVLRSEQQPEQPVISYICALKPRPGALNLVKCVEQGVTPGPLLGQLKNGHDVVLPCGKVVHSVDVTEPGETALSFVFIDVPSEDYLQSLQAQAQEYKKLAATQLTEVAVVVHFTPATLTAHPDYRRFMEQNFSQCTQHIYLNSPKNPFSGYAAAHRIQYQLHQLEPNIFPLLAESDELQRSCPSSMLSHSLKKTKLNEQENLETNHETEPKQMDGMVMKTETEAEQGVTSMASFHLRPKKGLDRTLEAKLTPLEYVKETHAVPGFTELLAQLHNEAQLQRPDTAVGSYPRIIFLGTGSCIPNKTRNVSSILIQTAAEAFMLLDCGEGTHGQIVRLYGRERAEQIMRQLHAVYISHLHADHHIGLIGLLHERQRLMPAAPLLLLAPRQIEPWLQFYNRQIEPIADAYTLVGNGEMLDQPLADERVQQQLGIASIATCLVRHCPHAYGISLTLHAQHEGEPVKLTYSGDTMPCADLVQLGRNSTVLIHEATMEDDLEEEARIKTHSTVSQAIQQGRDMQAKHTILTHFSQRYAKCPRLPSSEDMQHVAIAFDNMQVTVDDLKHYHRLYPALLAMYAEYTEELEQRAVKRELKQERKRKLAQT